MKVLKFSTVFKSGSEGTADIAHEGVNGFSIVASHAQHTLGFRYKGPNDFMLVRDLKKAKKWAIGEIDLIDFNTALEEAFTPPEPPTDLKRINLEALADGVGYSGKPVDPSEDRELVKWLWLFDGDLYGTDGHRLMRTKRVLPGAPRPFALSLPMLQGFLGLVNHDKKSAWAGVIYDEDAVRLVGGNDSVEVWYECGMIDFDGWTILPDYFKREEDNLDENEKLGVFVMDNAPGAIYLAVKTGPRVGSDGDAASFSIWPDRIEFMNNAQEPFVDLPPIQNVTLLPGEHHVATGEYIRTSLNWKYLMQALDVPGKVVLFTKGGQELVWLGDGTHTTIIMPMRFWKENDLALMNVAERAAHKAQDAEFESAP